MLMTTHASLVELLLLYVTYTPGAGGVQEAQAKRLRLDRPVLGKGRRLLPPKEAKAIVISETNLRR